MTRALVILMLSLLAACAPRPGPAPVDTGQVVPPNFGDSDPFEWTGRTPESYPVHGTDTSRFQARIDWATARRSGVNFAFIKATEGGDLLDPAFKMNWNAAADAGVPRGAYHFYYFCTDAATQARWFIENVPRERGALPPVLDLEWNPRSPTCRLRPPPERVRAEVKRFLDIVARRYGQRPIIYTTPEFWEDNDLGRLGREEFWLRSTAAHPSEAYPGVRWTFWQYSGTGQIPGIEGRADLNAFSGSREAWARWLAARRR